MGKVYTIKDMLGMPELWEKLEDYNFSVRTANCLKNDNIIYVGQLLVKTESALLRLSNFGRVSLNEIKEFLTARGWELGSSFLEIPEGKLNEELATMHLFSRHPESRELDFESTARTRGVLLTAATEKRFAVVIEQGKQAPMGVLRLQAEFEQLARELGMNEMPERLPNRVLEVLADALALRRIVAALPKPTQS